MSFRGALILALVALVGCLPRHALTRRDEVEAALYTLALDVDVTTEGLPVAPFRYHLDGAAAWSYTRTFRDGSMGHMVRFQDVKARVERDGAGVDVPVPWADAVFEVRAFPDGEVLLVSGIAKYVGTEGHLELLDVLWPGLSPRLPGSKAEAASFASSWPSWVAGGPKVRNRLVAAWTKDDDTWRYAGALDARGGYVKASGKAEGTVVLGDDAARLRAHTFAWERTVETRWPPGATVRQTLRMNGSLTHAGTAPTPPLDLPIAEDDRAADALPLRLRDGRVAEDPPADVAATAPFLFLPDDLSVDERAGLRAQVGGTW